MNYAEKIQQFRKKEGGFGPDGDHIYEKDGVVDTEEGVPMLRFVHCGSPMVLIQDVVKQKWKGGPRYSEKTWGYLCCQKCEFTADAGYDEVYHEPEMKAPSGYRSPLSFVKRVRAVWYQLLHVGWSVARHG
jgi:hypothetical protein